MRAAGSDMKQSREKGAYVKSVRADTRRHLHDVLAENDKLRALADSLETEKKNLANQLNVTKGELEQHTAEQAELIRKIRAIAAESQKLSEDYVYVEQQNSNLANLYVAACRLHESVERDQVLLAIREIIINLVG